MSIKRIKKDEGKPVKKTAKPKIKVKLKSIKVKNKEVSLIDLLVPQLGKTKTHKWSNKGGKDILEGMLEGKGLIKINFPKDFDGDFVIEVDDKAEPIFKKLQDINNMDITDKDVRDSIFKMTSSKIKNGALSKLGKNKIVFDEITKWFKDLGFTKVGIKDSLGYELEKKAFKELTLCIKPEMNNSQHTDMHSNLFTKYKKLKGFIEPRYVGSNIKPLPTEKIKDIKSGINIIGKYYIDRNLVILFFSPFEKVDLEKVMSYKEIEYITTLTADLEQTFKSLKMEVVDNEKFLMLMTVKNFNREGEERLKKLKTDLVKKRNDQHSYESKLLSLYQATENMGADIKALESVNSGNVDDFLAQIAKLKKVPIITDVKLNDGTISITFKETTIKSKFGRNVEGNNEGPIREMFIGAITAHLHGGTSITVSCNYPTLENSKAHPHANSDGSPCLGSGDGPNMMFKLIGQNNFADFAYVFWMWIKRWRPSDCYISPAVYYDDRLKQGLPVFDQVGNRININDEGKIKDGEQLKLTTSSEYDVNIKKYKGFKSVQ